MSDRLNAESLIQAHDSRTGKQLYRTTPARMRGNLVFNRAGNLLASGAITEQVALINLTSELVAKKLPGRSSEFHSNGLAFSPMGKLLATGSHDGAIQIWELESGRLARTFH